MNLSDCKVEPRTQLTTTAGTGRITATEGYNYISKLALHLHFSQCTRESDAFERARQALEALQGLDANPQSMVSRPITKFREIDLDTNCGPLDYEIPGPNYSLAEFSYNASPEDPIQNCIHNFRRFVFGHF
jgi:hypothetical protein